VLSIYLCCNGLGILLFYKSLKKELGGAEGRDDINWVILNYVILNDTFN